MAESGTEGAAEAAPVPVPQQAVETPTVIEEVPSERLASSAPFPVGWEDDVYCAGWIGVDKEPVTGRIVAAERGRGMRGIEGDLLVVVAQLDAQRRRCGARWDG